jgi:hypothetical protein
MTPLEQTILRQLFDDVEYAQRVVPYLQVEYFPTPSAATIYKLYHAFFEKFKKVPPMRAIEIGLDSIPSLNERQAAEAKTALASVAALSALAADNKDWLLEDTEDFCQERAMYLALQKAIQLMDDADAPRHAIPDLMKDALAVSFDTHVGHDFFEDADARYDFYHQAGVAHSFRLAIPEHDDRRGLPPQDAECGARRHERRQVTLPVSSRGSVAADEQERALHHAWKWRKSASQSASTPT